MPRPPGFQRDDVVLRATEVFWHRGYGATSVCDLVKATGLKPGSLYAAFGSKKGLFLEVLDHYHSDYLRAVDEEFARAASSLAAIESLFRQTADASLKAQGSRGCLAVNALLELAQHDEDIAHNLQQGSERLRRRLKERLTIAQTNGELRAAANPDELSAFLINNLWGMRVLCKSKPTATALDGIVHGVLAAISASSANRIQH